MKVIALLILFSLSRTALATLGGPEQIEVLGYEPTEQKIFVLRHYHDQSGRLAQLYYYGLKTKRPDQLQTVKSLYTTHSRSPLQAEQQFNRQLQQIKQRLYPLMPLPNNHIVLKITKQKLTHGNFWTYSHPSDAFHLNRYQQHYVLCSKDLSSPLQMSTSYKVPELKLVQAWQVKGLALQLAVVEYHGIAIETGYTRQDPVLLRNRQHTKCKN